MAASENFKKELLASLPGARRYALTLVRNAVDADDLVQEAIERALAKSGAYESGTNFKAWLNKIIKNVFLDEQKSHRVARTSLMGDDESGVMDINMATASTGEVEIEISEVQEFLFTLPDTERTVVMLWAEGYSYEEIASELSITRSNTGVLLCRARKLINDRFGG